jgi:hypothetical protein
MANALAKITCVTSLVFSVVVIVLSTIALLGYHNVLPFEVTSSVLSIIFSAWNVIIWWKT